MRLSGVVPPLITPMTPDGGLDLPSLDRLVDHLIGAGADGLFVLGSSGQVAYLTDAERDRVTERVVTRAAGRLPVVVGTVDLTARRVIEQARRAAELGADGVVVTAPLYALNDPAEVRQHFRLVAAAVSVPVLAYDVPVRVGSKLTPDLLLDLAADGAISAVKDSSGDDVSFRQLVARNAEAGSPLQVLTGHEVICDAMALLGADGAVPGLANVDPAGYVRLWRAAQSGDWIAATAEQARLERLFRIVEVPIGRSADSGGIGAFKAALELLGVIESGAMPAPLRGLDEAEKTAVAALLVEAGLR
ncbi:MAG: dihydrodipicolinate synthase family protein [Nakamurella multipartita]